MQFLLIQTYTPTLEFVEEFSTGATVLWTMSQNIIYNIILGIIQLTKPLQPYSSNNEGLNLFFVSHSQQSWKPISVGSAVQTGTTILPQEGKRKAAYRHKNNN